MQRSEYTLSHMLAYIRNVVLILLPVILVLSSCIHDEVCEEVATLPLRIGFYMEAETEGDEPIAIAIDSISIHGLHHKQLIYNNQPNVSQIELPLKSTADSCAFVFQFPLPQGITINDTLWINYQRKPNLISMECGFVMFYDIKQAYHTSRLIESIEINNTSIRNNLNEHIKIFPYITMDDDE